MSSHRRIHRHPRVFPSTRRNLIRYLRSEGLRTRAVSLNPRLANPPTPCIAAIRLGGAHGVGRYLVIYEAGENFYIFGNPETGRYRWSKQRAWDNYFFTGLFICVEAQ